MAKIVAGDLIGKGLKFCIVLSRFNEFITGRLKEGALDVLLRSGVNEEDIDIVMTPGTFELPVVSKMLSKSGRYSAVICLGAIIRGETPHFEYVANEVTKGIAKVSLDGEIPVTFGVITSDSIEQAIERAGTKSGNKGRDAALTAIEMANLFKAIKEQR